MILSKGTIVAVKLTPADLQGASEASTKYSSSWVIFKCFESGTTYRVREPITSLMRQVPRSKLKVLELSDEPGTRPGEELPKCAVPWTGNSTLTLVPMSTAQPQALNPEAHLTGAELGEQELLRQETPSLADSVMEPTSGAGPLREGIRWTVSRQARGLHAEYSFLRDEIAVLSTGGG